MNLNQQITIIDQNSINSTIIQNDKKEKEKHTYNIHRKNFKQSWRLFKSKNEIDSYLHARNENT